MSRKAWFVSSTLLLSVALLMVIVSQRSRTPQRVYRIGFENDPPFHFPDSAGRPSGMIVEMIQAAARRAGVQLEWVYYPGSSEEALRGGHVDLWPIVTIRPERRPFIYFTDPYRQSEGCLVVRAERPYRRFADVDGLTVVHNGMPLATRQFGVLAPRAKLRSITQPRTMLEAVCAGQADAAYLDEFAAVAALLDGPDCGGRKLRVIQAPEMRGLLAIGSTFAAAPIADALRERITDLVFAGEMQALTERWSYFTGRSMELNSALVLARRDARVATSAAAGAFVLVLLLVWLAWRLRLQRNRAKAAEHALAASESHYHSLVDLMPDSLFVLNLDGSIRSAHSKSIALPRDPGGHRASCAQESVFPPESAVRHHSSARRVLEIGAMLAEEEQLRDGSWIETRLLPMRASDGQIHAIMGIARDISARKLAEARLAAHQERFRYVLESTAAGYFRIGLDGCYQTVNKAWLDMHRCSEEGEAVGHHYSEFQASEDLAKANDVITSVLAGVAGQGELSRRCRDGSLGYHTYSVSPVLEGGAAVGMEGFLIDTTAQRAAEMARRHMESRHGALFNHMTEGVALHEILLDPEGRPVNYIILDVNPRFEEILGIRRSAVINRLATEVYGVSEPPYLAEFIAPCLSGKGHLFETYFPPLEKHFSIAVAPLDRTHFATIFSDITGRKRAEEDRTRLEDQLRQAQKMESIGRLAGGIAHDFNNLLTVINGYSEMLLACGPSTECQRTGLTQIAQAGRQAASLTAQLLAFSRRQIIQPRPLNLNHVVAEAGEMLRRLITEDIELQVELESDLARVMADSSQLHQVLMNLVLNARDAMPAGGRLLIETANVVLDERYTATHAEVTPGPSVMLAVSDTGHGMDELTLRRVFEPFFTTKGPGAGTGLGLSTVYGIVHQNGGWIWAYSEPGKGSTFKIYLPRLDEAPAAPEPFSAAGEGVGFETILLVEDQEQVREFAALALSDCGYRVIEAPNGLAAMDVARQYEGDIHLLLTDVVMPGMGGRELAETLIQERPEIKVLYSTGYTENVIVQHGVLKSGLHYLAKPFTPRVLTAKVREVLDSQDQPTG